MLNPSHLFFYLKVQHTLSRLSQLKKLENLPRCFLDREIVHIESREPYLINNLTPNNDFFLTSILNWILRHSSLIDSRIALNFDS